MHDAVTDKSIREETMKKLGESMEGQEIVKSEEGVATTLKGTMTMEQLKIVLNNDQAC